MTTLPPEATVQRALLRHLLKLDDGRYHTLSDVARSIYITPASARVPAHRLEERGLIDMHRYGGKVWMQITDLGRAALAPRD